MAEAKSGLRVSRQEVLVTFSWRILGTPNILFSYITFLDITGDSSQGPQPSPLSPVSVRDGAGPVGELLSDRALEGGDSPALVVELLPVQTVQQLCLSKMPEVKIFPDLQLLLKQSLC